jgi:hypothetical protein
MLVFMVVLSSAAVWACSSGRNTAPRGKHFCLRINDPAAHAAGACALCFIDFLAERLAQQS